MRRLAFLWIPIGVFVGCPGTGAPPRHRAWIPGCGSERKGEMRCLCARPGDLEELTVAPDVTSLELLDVDPETDLRALERFPQIRALHIGNASPAQLGGLGGLRQIERLVIDLRPLPTPVSLSPLAGMRRLEFLAIGCEGELDAAPVASLRALREVRLSRHCRVIDDSPFHGALVRRDGSSPGGLGSICDIDPSACRVRYCREGSSP